MKYNFLIFFLLVLLAFIIPQLNIISKERTVSKDPVFVIETNQGDIVVRLFPKIAPKAVENFVGLAQKEYYNNTTFHRIIPQFMIQAGDPTATGAGGKSIWNKPFADEFDPTVNFDKPFLLAMANAGPSTNGSQFFITTVPTPWLNKKHTIFGEVIKGQEVVKKIEAQGTNSGRPQNTQTIIKVYASESDI
jgi:peptidylprolyl isomerase